MEYYVNFLDKKFAKFHRFSVKFNIIDIMRSLVSHTKILLNTNTHGNTFVKQRYSTAPN